MNTARLVARIRQLSRPLEPEPTGFPERIQALPGIRVVLFDIYGTLVVSGSGDIGVGNAEDSETAFRASLEDAGLVPERGLDEGFPGTECFEDVIREFHAESREAGVDFPEVDIPQVWSRVLERLPGGPPADGVTDTRLRDLALEYECRTNPVWPMPGMGETIEALGRAGKRLGIVSNAQFYTPLLFHAFLDRSPEELGFDPELCSWSYRLGEAKPSPGMFRPILERLQGQGVAPEQVLYVGNDMLKDVWPASRLGCRTALFAGDRRSLRLRDQDPRCSTLQPDLVVGDLPQLPGCV